MTPDPVTFVHISDTHFGPSPGYARHGRVALPAAQRIVDAINRMPVKPDFVVHTGDVVTAPGAAAYALAAETLGGLECPVYFVCGNHDDPAGIQTWLRMGALEPLLMDGQTLAFAWEVGGVRFVVLDTHGPPEIDPQGVLDAAQLALLQAEARPEGPPLVLFWHHPIMPMDSPWMDRNMLVQNGAALHQALLPARDRIRGVFYGHVHQSQQTVRDGILYVAAASTFAQFSSWPTDETVGYVPEETPGFNFVRVWPERIMIRQHRLPSS